MCVKSDRAAQSGRGHAFCVSRMRLIPEYACMLVTSSLQLHNTGNLVYQHWLNLKSLGALLSCPASS